MLSAIALTVSLLFSNCATIVTKSSYPLTIDTNPPGATVVVLKTNDGTEVFRGTSPTSVQLKAGAGYFAKAGYEVKLSSDGYEDMSIPVEFKFDGWYIGNIVFGGLIGMLIVDPLTGAMYRLGTPPINVTMKAANSTVQAPRLEIIDINTIPETMKESLVRIN